MYAKERFREADKRIQNAQLNKYTFLDLSNWRLRSLPESLSQLTRLQRLDLSGSHLTSLPESIGQLNQLQQLDLTGNQLTSLPRSLGHMKQLKELILNRNRLASLPESLGQLTKLRHLDLVMNQLKSLPESLKRLTQLKHLDLARNQLTTLPECLGQLICLQYLDLSGNKITSLPKSLGQLVQLQQLDLSDNQLSSLPESLGRLKYLKGLFLYRNQLTSLPEFVGQFTQLQKLLLYENNIKTLPKTIGRLTQLSQFDLDENPLNPELAAAYAHGLQDIKAYLQAKVEEQIMLNEAKLLLVGEGGVGKTTLLGALQGEPFIENRPTTHGVEVDITSLQLSLPGDINQITFNSWDFGGQNIYRHTHQLFFTAPAIYLVVWNPRSGPEVCYVDEWIKMIKHRAYDESRPEDKPKIIVVATHGGPRERLAHIDEQKLRDQFGDLIVGFYHIDSKPSDDTGERFGIDNLKNEIARTATGISSVGRKVASSWKRVLIAVRKRSLKDAFISSAEFESLCAEQEVAKGLSNTYAKILNELGYLIHYSGTADLKNTIILKPEWLSKAISFVLEDKQTKDQNGLVEDARLSEIWNDPSRKKDRYPELLHPIFIKLMEQYDLSYRVNMPYSDARDTSLIAQLVPGGRPEGWEKFWPPELLPGDTERMQVCRIMDAETGRIALVEGLVYRLIVRLHRYSLGRENYFRSQHWKTGMILDDNYNGRAFIEDIGGDIRITVRAAYPERFLHLLCEDVKWLVNYFWKGLECKFAVPCGTSCKGLIELQEMFDYLEEGIEKVRCPVCRKFPLINEKLATVAPKPEFSYAVDELKQGQAEIKRGIENGIGAVRADLRRLIGQADEQFAALMTTLNDPAKDGPRLFSFKAVKPGFWDKPKWLSEKFRLTLWCEHSRLPLPLLNGDEKQGVYDLELSREWVKQAAPILKVLFSTLSLALPVAGSAMKFSVDEPAYKGIEKQLDFGQKFAGSFFKGSEQISPWLTNDDETRIQRGEEIRAHGSMLRELHSLIKEKDPRESYGGLERVQNKRREFLWVHPQFVDEY